MATKRFERELQYTATWAAGVLTVTTPTHFLVTGDTVRITSLNAPHNLIGAVTVTAATTFTMVASEEYNLFNIGAVTIDFFRTGQTGAQTQMFGLVPPTVIQLTAAGAGGAVIVIEVSNDKKSWTTLATVTIAAADKASDFVPLTNTWATARLNITSIGAGTAITVTAAY